MRSRAVAVLLGSSLCIASGAGVAIADDEKSPNPLDREGTHLSDSSALSTPTVASGRVIGRDGRPVANASVVLMAWPSNDVMASVVVGDRITLQPVAKARTSADGSYALRLASTNLVEPIAGRDRLVNFSVFAGSGKDSADPYSFGRRLAGNARDAVDEVLQEPGAPATDPATPADPVGVDLRLGDVGRSTASGPSMSVAQGAGGTPIAKSCHGYYKKDLGRRRVLVGATYNNNSYVEAGFEFRTSAVSTLGTAISASGAFGTFKRAGTTSRSASGSVTFAKSGHRAKRFHDTWFRYGLFWFDCTLHDGTTYKSFWDARSLYWLGSGESRVLGSSPRTGSGLVRSARAWYHVHQGVFASTDVDRRR